MVVEMLQQIAAKGYELRVTRDVSGFRVDLFDPETARCSVFPFNPDRYDMSRLTDDELITYNLQKLLKKMDHDRKANLMSTFKKEE